MIDKGDFIDNFNDECVSFIMGIGNNINFLMILITFVKIKMKILIINFVINL